MHLTRLQRSASSDKGTEPSATTIDTIDTSPPSWPSLRPQYALRCGNIDTTTWRSTKSKIISAKVSAKTLHAWPRETGRVSIPAHYGSAAPTNLPDVARTNGSRHDVDAAVDVERLARQSSRIWRG